MQQSEDLRKAITDEIERGYQRIFHKRTPAVLTSGEIGALGIRPRTALDKDVTTGKGLLPLPGGSRGRPRRYLLSHVVQFLTTEQA